MKPFRLSEALPADLPAAYDHYSSRSTLAAESFATAYLETRDRIIAQPLLNPRPLARLAAGLDSEVSPLRHFLQGNGRLLAHRRNPSHRA